MKKLAFMFLIFSMALMGCEEISHIFTTQSNSTLTIELIDGTQADIMAVIDIETSIITQANVTLLSSENSYEQEHVWYKGLSTTFEFSRLDRGYYLLIIDEWDSLGYYSCSSNSVYINSDQNQYLSLALGQNISIRMEATPFPDFTNYVTNQLY